MLIAANSASFADSTRAVATAAPRTPQLDQKAILDLEAKIATAQLQRDFAFLDSVLAGDMLYIGSDGRTAEKKDYLDEVKSNRLYSSYVNKDIGVRLYGDVAIAEGIHKVAGTFGGQKSSLSLVSTKVWAYRMNKWQIVHWQSTTAPPSGMEMLLKKLHGQ